MPTFVGHDRTTSALPGKNVLVLVENLSVPFDRRVWQECEALRDGGYGVSVVCPRGSGRDEAEFERLNGVEIHRYPLRPANGGVLGYGREYAAALWRTWRLIRRLAKTRRFDVVHACNPPDLLFLPALALRRAGAVFVFDHHDLVPELYLSRFGRGRDLGYRLTRLLERVAFTLADVVIATNGSYRRLAIERGGVSPENVFVVRSAPDTSLFQQTRSSPQLRKGKRHLLVYLGVMGPQDGVDHALRALAELRRRREDWHAVFVGAGDVFHAMRQLCEELGLDDHVDFPGRVPNEELLRILSTADVALAPDPKNPLNDVSTMNKILEYMALGVPIVSYDLAEARVSAGDAAVYATPNDPTAFASAIDKLLAAPQERSAMAAIGRRRIAGVLGWEHSRRTLMEAYSYATTLRASPDS